MAFGLARRVATQFDGFVDALYVKVRRHDSVDLLAAAMPRVLDLEDERFDSRARESRRAFYEALDQTKGATFATVHGAQHSTLLSMGRCADLVVVGRPGADPENRTPTSLSWIIGEESRPVMVAPPEPGEGPFGRIVVAWNGSVQAARAAAAARPFLARAEEVTILMLGEVAESIDARQLERNLVRAGIPAIVATTEIGDVTGRARGRALLEQCNARKADLLVMGAFGGGQMTRFFGLGGATSKVITSSRVPVLLAR